MYKPWNHDLIDAPKYDDQDHWLPRYIRYHSTS